MKKLLSILFLSQLINSAIFAGLEVKNLEALKKHFGLQNVGNQRNLTRLKIAIVDNGFPNPKYGTIQLGKDVPLNTTIYDYTAQKPEEYIKRFPVQIRDNVKFYSPELLKQIKAVIPDGEELTFDETDHLRRMAKVVYSLTGENENGPEFILLNGNGYLMEMAAYVTAIKLGANVILHSVTDSVEEFPEFDKLFRDMKKRGIIFINAAGNERGLVVVGTIGNEFKLGRDGYVKYNGEDIQFSNLLEDNLTDINLTWSRSEDEIVDLDFELQDFYGKDLTIRTEAGDPRKNARGASKQVLEIKDPNTEATLPAEYASFNLKETKKNQNYFLKIHSKNKELPNGLRIRVSIQGRKPPFQFDPNYKPVNAINITNASPNQQISFPANLPEVFTVGSTSEFSSLGPTMTGLSKPDVNLDYSTVSFNDGYTQDGSSYSAAIMAAIALVLKADHPELTTESLKKIAAAKFKTQTTSNQKVVLGGVRRAQQQYPQNSRDKVLVELHPTFHALVSKIEQTLGKSLNAENAMAVGLLQERRAVLGIIDPIEKLRSLFYTENLEKAQQFDWNNYNPHDYQFYVVQAVAAPFQNPQQQFQNRQQQMPFQQQQQQLPQQQQFQNRPGQGQPLLRPGQQNPFQNGMQRPGQYPGMQYPGMQNGLQQQPGQGQFPQLFPNMPQQNQQQQMQRGPSSLLEDAAQEQAKQPQRVFKPIPAGTIIGIIRPKNHNDPLTGSPYLQPWEIGHPNLPKTAGPYIEIRQLVTEDKARILRQREVPTDIPVWKALPTRNEIQKILQQN